MKLQYLMYFIVLLVSYNLIMIEIPFHFLTHVQSAIKHAHSMVVMSQRLNKYLHFVLR